MPKRPSRKTVETLTHGDASRKNIPTAEFRSVMERAEQGPVQFACRRNRDLDPQLVWRGKDAQDWSDLVVQAPPLFIQERVHPKVLIDDLRRRLRSGQAGDGTEVQPDLSLKTTLKAEIDADVGNRSTAMSRARSTARSRAASPSRSSTASATR